jgi:small subunit ribosomal protein S8
MNTDPIADMLTRIRNGVRARHPRVDMPASKMKVEIARILKEEGYVSTYKLVDENKRKVLRVFFRYTPDKRSVLTGLKRVSRPGCRRYVGKNEIRSVVGGMGVAILSTPRGIMSGHTARKEGVGGELLCEVW